MGLQSCPWPALYILERRMTCSIIVFVIKPKMNNQDPASLHHSSYLGQIYSPSDADHRSIPHPLSSIFPSSEQGSTPQLSSQLTPQSQFWTSQNAQNGNMVVHSNLTSESPTHMMNWSAPSVPPNDLLSCTHSGMVDAPGMSYIRVRHPSNNFSCSPHSGSFAIPSNSMPVGNTTDSDIQSFATPACSNNFSVSNSFGDQNVHSNNKSVQINLVKAVPSLSAPSGLNDLPCSHLIGSSTLPMPLFSSNDSSYYPQYGSSEANVVAVNDTQTAGISLMSMALPKSTSRGKEKQLEERNQKNSSDSDGKATRNMYPSRKKSSFCFPLVLEVEGAWDEKHLFGKGSKNMVSRRRDNAKHGGGSGRSFATTGGISGLLRKNLDFVLCKVLKATDVSCVKRIILPKKDVELHMPRLNEGENLTLVVRDAYSSYSWKMKFRFWANNRSRMYVLENTGGFAEMYALQTGDIVALYHDDKKQIYITAKKKDGPFPPDPVSSKDVSQARAGRLAPAVMESNRLLIPSGAPATMWSNHIFQSVAGQFPPSTMESNHLFQSAAGGMFVPSPSGGAPFSSSVVFSGGDLLDAIMR